MTTTVSEKAPLKIFAAESDETGDKEPLKPAENVESISNDDEAKRALGVEHIDENPKPQKIGEPEKKSFSSDQVPKSSIESSSQEDAPKHSTETAAEVRNERPASAPSPPSDPMGGFRFRGTGGRPVGGQHTRPPRPPTRPR